MYHGILVNYFEFGSEASEMLDMSQFHRIFITNCGQREPTDGEKILNR